LVGGDRPVVQERLRHGPALLEAGRPGGDHAAVRRLPTNTCWNISC